MALEAVVGGHDSNESLASDAASGCPHFGSVCPLAVGAGLGRRGVGLIRSLSTFLLAPGWSASAELAFADWCIARPALPFRTDIVLGQGSLVVRPVHDAYAAIPVPPCMAQPATPPPSLDLDTPFATSSIPEPPAPDPGDILPFTVSISPLSTAAPGTELVYDVTLTNVSAYDKPINLAADCPTYTELLILPGNERQETTYALNCGPAGVLAAGSSATFEMHLVIPTTAPAGVATIVWQLGHAGSAAKATLQIGP